MTSLTLYRVCQEEPSPVQRPISRKDRLFRRLQEHRSALSWPSSRAAGTTASPASAGSPIQMCELAASARPTPLGFISLL